MAGTARALLHYLITGGLAAAVDIEGFALLCRAQVPVALAAACSFIVATIVNFLLTSRWVFRSTPTRRRYLVFLMGATLVLMMNVAVTYIGLMHVGLPPAPAKIVAIGATFLPSFWINAHIVFRKEAI